MSGQVLAGEWRRLVRSICCLVLLTTYLGPSAAYTELSDDALRNIPSGSEDFDIHSGSLLAPILIPRVPGTAGSATARRHFVTFFEEQLPGWKVEWHNVTSKTPATGDDDIPFTNLIFTRDPPSAQPGDVARLVLAAHYDSLYRPEGFVGAVDSAAPCAMLMHVARSIDAALTRKWAATDQAAEAADGLEDQHGVQILLFDGEEAWLSWTASDSLYGSRALAQAWEAQVHPATSSYPRPISSIELFVLLDLLGAPDPTVPSFFQSTHWAYRGMAKVEDRMRKLGMLRSRPQKPLLPDLDNEVSTLPHGYVEDDHIPFLTRGVNILHLIAAPFPPVWHTLEDDGEHLDIDTVDDWARIVTAFTAEWMELGQFMVDPVETEAPTRTSGPPARDEL